MFKNRSVQVKIVKNPENAFTDETIETATLADRVQIVRETVESVGEKVLVAFVVYVAADTLRQVLVKLTPTK